MAPREPTNPSVNEHGKPVHATDHPRNQMGWLKGASNRSSLTRLELLQGELAVRFRELQTSHVLSFEASL
jgi:hypothetical protein